MTFLKNTKLLPFTNIPKLTYSIALNICSLDLTSTDMMDALSEVQEYITRNFTGAFLK